jgi:exonuclease III
MEKCLRQRGDRGSPGVRNSAAKAYGRSKKGKYKPPKGECNVVQGRKHRKRLSKGGYSSHGRSGKLTAGNAMERKRQHGIRKLRREKAKKKERRRKMKIKNKLAKARRKAKAKHIEKDYRNQYSYVINSIKTMFSRFGTWNVRKMHSIKDPTVHRAIAHTLDKNNIDICAIQETNLAGNGKMDADSHVLHYSGSKVQENGILRNGVGCMVRKGIKVNEEQIQVTNTDRNMMLNVKIGTDIIYIIVTYAPHMGIPQGEKDKYYAELDSFLNKIPTERKCFVMGDLNARVGCKWEEKRPVMGPYGSRKSVDKLNKNGEMLIDLCQEQEMCIVDTCFKKETEQFTYFSSPDLTKGYQFTLDHILCKQRDRSLILDAGVEETSTTVMSDHKLLVMTISVEGKTERKKLKHNRNDNNNNKNGTQKSRIVSFENLKNATEDEIADFTHAVAIRVENLLKSNWDTTLEELTRSLASEELQEGERVRKTNILEAIFAKSLHGAGTEILGKKEEETRKEDRERKCNIEKGEKKVKIAYDKMIAVSSSKPKEWTRTNANARLERNNENRAAHKKASNEYRDAQKLVKMERTKHDNRKMAVLGKSLDKLAKTDSAGFYKKMRSQNLNSKDERPKVEVKVKDEYGNLQTGKKAAEVFRAFNDKLFNEPQNINVDDIMEKLGTNQGKESYEESEKLDAVITEEEVIENLKHIKNDKSPGEDDIQIEFVKFLLGSKILMLVVVILLNSILTTGNIPQSWKDAILTVLYKGKGKKTDTANYRPISLLSQLGKLLAKILQNRAQNFAEKNNIIDEAQSGFRKKRSTIDSIFAVRRLQETAIWKGCSVNFAFLDFTKAYDTVNRELLWRILERYGLTPKILNAIRNFHEGMETKVRVNGVLSAPYKVTNGLRQGCVLAPLLYNFYVNAIMEYMIYLMETDDCENLGFKIGSETIKLVLFADDAATIGASAEEIELITKYYNEAAAVFGQILSIKKCVALTVQGKNNSESPNIKIGQGTIENKSTCKYLGAIINNVGTDEDEVSKRISKAAGVFFGTCRGIFYGKLPMKLKVKYFKSMVLSTLLYGAASWTITVKMMQKLESFQFRCMIKMLGISRMQVREKRVSHVKALKLTNLECIESLISSLRLNYYGKIQKMSDNRPPKWFMDTLGKNDGKRILLWINGVKNSATDFNIKLDFFNDSPETPFSKNATKNAVKKGKKHYDKMIKNNGKGSGNLTKRKQVLRVRRKAINKAKKAREKRRVKKAKEQQTRFLQRLKARRKEAAKLTRAKQKESRRKKDKTTKRVKLARATRIKKAREQQKEFRRLKKIQDEQATVQQEISNFRKTVEESQNISEEYRKWFSRPQTQVRYLPSAKICITVCANCLYSYEICKTVCIPQELPN